MKTALEKQILNFDNWSQPWTFRKTIIDNLISNTNEIELFNEIWSKASDFKLWNNSDLILGCKMSQNFIRENYKLDDKVVANIVRAISYEWK